MQNSIQTPPAAATAITGQSASRALQVQRAAVDEAARTVTLAFASELPYERSYGMEILDCSPTAMRTARLRSGANLLCDHDTTDVVGVIESVEIGADRVGRAVVRFGKSARAEEVWQDVRDGIRRNVSVGYIVHKATLVETRDGLETYRINDWEPFEISLVSVPADATVGVGRSHDAPSASATPPAPTQETRTMPTPDIQVVAQRDHAAEISKIAATIPGGAEMAMSAIQRGLTVEAFQAEAIQRMASAPVPTSDIGMTDKEVQRFSVLRVARYLANPDASSARDIAFERECSDAVAKKMGRSAQGVFMPSDVMQRRQLGEKRDLVVGTPTAGGNLVATDLLSGSFIDMLRNAMVLTGMGTRTLSGLVGNVAIPKQTGGSTIYWVAENGAPTESQQVIGQVTMSPKTAGGFTDIGRTLMNQSSIDVENFVMNDLAVNLGLGIEQAAINGSGTSNQPSGLLTRITPSVIGGTNGAAPTWAHVVGLETNVAVANAAVNRMGYLVNAKTRGKLKTTEKFTGSNGMPVWADGNTPLNGYQAGVTNAVPSNLTKGTASGICSAAIFGDFSSLLIGLWGVTDLIRDPYTASSSGGVRIVALQDVDVAVRYTEAFVTMVDALTA